jgi:RNA 2',3'-cyclic 3'-phosphodiesterase
MRAFQVGAISSDRFENSRLYAQSRWCLYVSICSCYVLKMFAIVQQGRVVFAPLTPVGLFFSIFPDAATAARIVGIAQYCRREYGLSGRPHATSRFHISLQCLGEHDEEPEQVVADARKAAASVRMRPFAVMFDRIASFSGREGNYPLVLLGDDGVVGLTMLYQSLGTAMRNVGLEARLDFTPHMTLLYDDRRIGERPIKPICWTVRELVLVLSLIRKTKYVFLGRWPLRG